MNIDHDMIFMNSLINNKQIQYNGSFQIFSYKCLF